MRWVGGAQGGGTAMQWRLQRRLQRRLQKLCGKARMRAFLPIPATATQPSLLLLLLLARVA